LKQLKTNIMRNEFNNLVETLKRWDLYQIGDEVDMALTDLSDKIAEVEKRIECVKRTNVDSHEILFTNQVKLEESIGYDNVEILQRSVTDINIALDLTINEPIECNWYGLFEEPKEEIEDKFKPRSVAEYVATLPKEEPKVLIPKDSIVEWKETRQYYSVNGGAKARVTEDYTTEHESNDNCVKVEWLDEKANNQQNGGYFRDMFKEDFELPSVPTFLCYSDDNHNIVKDIIAKLKVIDVDGETMQYILKEVGMEDQMLRQLIMSSTESNTKDLLEEKRILSNQGKLV
jgi:hypothetical protein